MTSFELQENLKSASVYALTLGAIILLTAGVVTLINQKNVKIESRCQEQGGQVLRTPGELSRCLLPPAR